MSTFDRSHHLPHSSAAPTDDSNPEETREWLEALEAVVREAGHERGLFLPKRIEEQARQLGIVAAGGAHHLDHSLDRSGHGGESQPGVWRSGWPHREFRLGGGDFRGRFQPFLPRGGRRPRGRPRVLPAPLRPGRLCPRVSGRTAQRAAGWVVFVARFGCILEASVRAQIVEERTIQGAGNRGSGYICTTRPVPSTRSAPRFSPAGFPFT